MYKLNKNLIPIFLFVFLFNSSFAQHSIGLKLGGANFIGGSINYNYKLETNFLKERYILISTGLGYTPWGPSYIFNGSISYHQKRIGIGIDHTRFYNEFFFETYGSNNFIDLLLYPNISYQILNKRIELTFSSGTYFAFSRYRISSNDRKMSFLGDIIPGAGLSINYNL